MRIFTRILCIGVAALLSFSTAFATDRGWLPTSGSNDFANGANWSGGFNPAGGDRGFVNSTVAANVTNIAYRTGSYQMFGSDGVGVYVDNNSGAGINMFLVNSGHFEMQDLEIGNRGIVQILNGGTISAYSKSFNFTGGTLWLNGGNFQMNGESAANYTVNGTVISDSGTLILNPFNDRNNGLEIASGGKMIANSGTFWVSTRSGTSSFNGMTVQSGGQIVVNNGATFVLDRNGGAWTGGTVPQNNGNIILNGGTFTVAFNGGQAVDRPIQNNGSIIGSGTLAMRVNQSSTGFTIASNGTLNVFQTIAGNQQSFTSVSGQFGSFKAVSGGTMKFNGTVVTGMGGAWTIDNGGTFDINSQSVDLGTAFMPGSNIKGTIRVATGGNFTFASTVAGGGYNDNQGTLDLQGGSVFAPNDPANSIGGEFTNSATGTIIGNGLMKTGFGGGGAPDYGIMNKGVITATNGTLTLRPEDAFNLGGVQNAAGGLMTVKNDATLTFTRTDNAWFSSGVGVTNLGGINLQGGLATLRGSNTTVSTQAGKLVNASGGTITGSGTIMGYTLVENSGKIVATGGDFDINPLGTGYLDNKSGGVISNQAVTFTADASVTNNGIIVNSGDFVVTSAGRFGGSGGITNTSRLIVNSNFTNTYSGVISGTGSLTKGGSSASKLILTGANTYTGTTLVNAGTLAVDGTIRGVTVVNSGAMLQGSGTVGSISGAGRVGPGNSPGILTASSVNPTAGTDYAYEFTQTGDPIWSSATASGNDVLRLTAPMNPFSASLTAANTEDIFLSVATLSLSDTFRGAFYTDENQDFTASVSGADYNYYVLGDGNGLATTFNGQGYYTLAQFSPALAIQMTVVQVPSANYSGGTVLLGWVQQFSTIANIATVPEPTMLAMLLGGLGIIYASRRRNRKR